MRKKVLRMAALLVVLLAVAVLVIAYNMGRIVKVGVEEGGTRALGVPTSLGSASVSLLGGTAGLDQLALGNPEGFATAKMFELEHAHVAVDVWSLRRDEIIVHEVVIDGPEITVEIAGGKTNWGVVMNRLKSEPSEEEQTAGKAIRIDRIVFTNARVRVSGLPLADETVFVLPDVEVEGLSTADGKGVQIAKVLSEIVASLNQAIFTGLKDAVSPENLQAIDGEMRSVLAGASELLGGSEPDAGETGGGGLGRVGGALGNMLGGQENQEDGQ